LKSNLNNWDKAYQIAENINFETWKEPSPTPIPDDSYFIYTIAYWDTLTSIAREFGVTVESIAKLNDIKNINLIYAGDRLRIEG